MIHARDPCQSEISYRGNTELILQRGSSLHKKMVNVIVKNKQTNKKRK